MIRRLDARLRDLRTPMRRMGRVMAHLVDQTFVNEESPEGVDWTELRPATLLWRRRKGYRASPKLDASGFLRRSITVDSGRSSVIVRAVAPYADIHQFGNPRNRAWGKGKAPIPARPFMPLKGVPDKWWRDLREPLDEIFRT